MTSQDNAPLRYKAFVEEGTNENPYKDLYGGMILGKKQFIKDALALLAEDRLGKDDTPAQRFLKTSLSPEEIAETTSRTLHVSPQEITGRKGTYRNLALYCARKHTSFLNPEIGTFFGNISHSAVAKACGRFEEAMASDKALCGKLEKVVKTISTVKG